MKIFLLYRTVLLVLSVVSISAVLPMEHAQESCSSSTPVMELTEEYCNSAEFQKLVAHFLAYKRPDITYARAQHHDLRGTTSAHTLAALMAGAKLKHGGSLYTLSKHYLFGIGVPQDEEKGDAYLWAAIDGKYVPACVTKGLQWYLEGDYVSALELFYWGATPHQPYPPIPAAPQEEGRLSPSVSHSAVQAMSDRPCTRPRSNAFFFFYLARRALLKENPAAFTMYSSIMHLHNPFIEKYQTALASFTAGSYHAAYEEAHDGAQKRFGPSLF